MLICLLKAIIPISHYPVRLHPVPNQLNSPTPTAKRLLFPLLVTQEKGEDYARAQTLLGKTRARQSTDLDSYNQKAGSWFSHYWQD